MSLNWIKPEEYSMNCLLLMDEFMIEVIAKNYRSMEFKKHLSIILAYNPHILWYFVNRCPRYMHYFNELVKDVKSDLTTQEVRSSEVFVLNELDTLIVYTYPEVMEKLTYITGWDPERVLSITDFKDKKVLDLGSGTGRLAFAVAPFAKWVYACEPSERLRSYLKEKQKRLQVKNMFVLDGFIEAIPFEDDSFDIIVAGHVIGDNYEEEYKELSRVLKSGGYIIDCPGEDERKRPGPLEEMIQLGFHYSHYVSKYGGDVYRYWKKINK